MRTVQALSARVKFMIRDIVELRKSKWVPRRQKEEAKKISEIHAAAHAELGMIPAAVLPGLAPLPAHSRAAVPGLADDVELFPAFKGDGERLCACRSCRKSHCLYLFACRRHILDSMILIAFAILPTLKNIVPRVHSTIATGWCLKPCDLVLRFQLWGRHKQRNLLRKVQTTWDWFSDRGVISR